MPFDRCCNPFNLPDHWNRTGLRKISSEMAQKYDLSAYLMVCTKCRNNLRTTPPVGMVYQSDNERGTVLGDSTEENSQGSDKQEIAEQVNEETAQREITSREL